MRVVTIRNIYTEECPWLEKDILIGTELFKYNGYTYGCISDKGIAVCEKEGEIPFFEVPLGSIE